MGWYDTALICENGHVVNKSVKEFPQGNTSFCETCGAKTISSCPECGGEIRGTYHVEGFIGTFDYTTPKYCEACGSPFPWTKTAIDELKNIAREMGKLSPQERA